MRDVYIYLHKVLGLSVYKRSSFYRDVCLLLLDLNIARPSSDSECWLFLTYIDFGDESRSTSVVFLNPAHWYLCGYESRMENSP